MLTILISLIIGIVIGFLAMLGWFIWSFRNFPR